MTVEGSLPVIGELSYTATVPFNILVDVEDRSVETWNADLGAASITSNQ